MSASITPSIRERLAELTLELIRIPSVTGDEKRIADYLEAWAHRQRALPREEIIRDGNGLIVGVPDDTRPCVALVGHTDTVPPHPDSPPPGREGDRITGLGASDMKGSLAVMMCLLENLDLEVLPFSLMLVFYDREEGPYTQNGLQPLLERQEVLAGADLAIAMEPTDNTLQLGCLGGIHAKVTFTGRAAHSARPWQGENAIHKAGRFLTALHERPARERQIEGLTFREVMSATTAAGGRARNTIPDRFELNVNYRFAPVAPLDGSVHRAVEEVKRVAEGATVEIVDVAPPGPVPVHNPILEHIRAHNELALEPKQAWTDVARLAQFDIEAINFGPGFGAQAHQRGEWISLHAMCFAYEVLARSLTARLA